MCYRTLAECCLSTLFFSASWPAHISNTLVFGFFCACAPAHQPFAASFAVQGAAKGPTAIQHASSTHLPRIGAVQPCATPAQRRILTTTLNWQPQGLQRAARPRRRTSRFPGTREPCAALAAAAALASIKVLPRESIIYAWGWTVILPLSLALTLIGRESKGIKDGAATRRVGAAFAAGAVSSVAGAFAAAKLLRPTLGAAADKGAAALAASYVGGSANFFVVAEAVGLKNNGLLAALATADVVVMAGYIVLLQCLASKYGAPRPETATVSKTEDAGSPVVPLFLGACCVAAAAPLKPSLRTAAISAYAVACRALRERAAQHVKWRAGASRPSTPARSLLARGGNSRPARRRWASPSPLWGHALLAACTFYGNWGVDEALVASNAVSAGRRRPRPRFRTRRGTSSCRPGRRLGTPHGTGPGRLYNDMLCTTKRAPRLWPPPC